MARTVNESLRTERRKQLLKSAELVFSQQGYKHATIDQIAQAAGVSHATVFLYFSNKKELFRAVILENLEKARGLYHEMLLQSKGDTTARLRAFVSAQIRIALRTSSYFRLVQHIIGQPEVFPEFTAELHRFADELIGLIALIVEEGQRDGVLDQGDARAIARSYFAYLNGLGMCVHDQDEETARQMTANGLKIFGLK